MMMDIVHEEETDSDTPSSTSASDDEDDDNEVEGTNVEGAKSDEEATYEEDQGNEAVQAPREIEDISCDLTTLILDGSQQSTSYHLDSSPNIHHGAILHCTNQSPSNTLKSARRLFSELRQTNQYAEALSSIPGTVDQYLAKLKMQGSRKVKKEVSKITPKIEKLVTDQLESEVLVRSSKEVNTSHVVAANLSELELKKILIDKMEANNSINRSDIQRHLYKALVDTYEADKILLDTYGDTVHQTQKKLKDLEMVQIDDDQETLAVEQGRGSKKEEGRQRTHFYQCSSERQPRTAWNDYQNRI
ncbi:hypothetical protein Tco_0553780 [Tanacetum coccineum]